MNQTLLKAQSLLDARRFDEARALLLPLAGRQPLDRNAANLLAVALAKLGQYDQARFHLERGLAAYPDDPALRSNLGQLLTENGRFDEALPHLRRAVELAPGNSGVWVNLAGALIGRRRYAEAFAVARAAVQRFPGHGPLTRQAAIALLDSGRAEQAAALLRDLVMREPNSTAAASTFAYTLNFVPGITPEALLSAHRVYADILSRLRPPRPETHPPRPTADDADRSLRVGFISGDFFTHSVAFFAEPLIQHADPSQVHITLYHTATNTDATSERFKKLAGAWRHVAWTEEQALLETIRKDRIDVLIDLSGHTANNRLPILHQRPAPLHMTWCGYPATTGVRAIDVRIVDSITDPAPEADPAAVERLVRLDPCFLAFRPLKDQDVPPPSPAPSAAGNPVTFGSFNALSKLNDPLLALWKRLLDAVPGSRLILKSVGLTEEEVRADLTSRFAALGIDPARVQLLPPTKTLAEHLALYARIDVALDHHPYNGTTTTCEALYMGVPVVTLRGRAGLHASRVGASLLTAVGLTELVADDEDAYVRTAAALATDPARLGALRSTLRDRLLASPLCDEPGFAQRFWTMVRGEWRRLCASGS